MSFDVVSFAAGKLAASGGNNLPTISGFVTTTDVDNQLIIDAPSGIDFSQYNRIAILLDGNFPRDRFGPPAIIASYPKNNGQNTYLIVDDNPMGITVTAYSVNFESDKITISANTSLYFIESDYFYIVWKE